ncbi:MAG: septal ring lytic transglycosylase RlpA family protein [Devosia sp.]|uniref:septal ring lytic transglycosylase RlpA family protein n=1 Tax=Devosia sp. TaxID=1871048 RepID=UPI0026056BA5|nr:septal ring lytic transglycosylase RlpA family protein [Devosia sp.]MDB5541189.1 septal ring lytic transglycosylase RlpA family protein [Devosia sp.]
MAVISRDLRAAARLLILAALAAPILAACGGGGGVPHVKRAAFSSKEFGVAVSPRVTNAKNPPRGGGRYMVGKPYTVRGDVYEPLENPVGYVASGSASWYGNDFHGRRTANGEIFSANAISCASPVLPLPSYVRVTNLDNGRSMVCRVNDRGPYLHGRVMDLSYRAAEILGYAGKGVGNIQVQYVGPAPLNGDDTRMLLASVDRLTNMEQQTTRLAMVDAPTNVSVSGGRINFADYQQQQSAPAAREDVLGDFIDLFGYAESGAADAAINSAHAAANAMATHSGALESWVDSVDEDKRAIRLELGVFTDPARADDVAQQFAMLGAVDEDAVRIPGANATRLTLTHLKPGVARNDVMLLAKNLGLKDLLLY